ncbi:MAG: bifunctional homocysteine S-methyltransferase/methylenetetrahydrofolate reductase, partial [Chloroflexi bacterium]|nr:bifunctional homocysteine S-methyltransferase/methylenetetrahydrofolate reductase [Chloroflexota bacterium]
MTISLAGVSADTISLAMEQSFLDRLSKGPLLADGAMGTELIRRAKVRADACLEHLNLTGPDQVRGVHLDYIEAGAEMVETNTYGANRVRLERHGLGKSLAEINRRGVELAREAQRLAGQRVWVAGAVGPLGRPLAARGAESPKEARVLFREQVQVLADAGVDLVMLETFPSLAEIREAIVAVREVGDLPIIAQLTFTQEGHTLAGDSIEEVVEALAPLDLAAIGANCSVGPDPMLRVMEEMSTSIKVPLSALPNAGLPTEVDGRLLYLSSPAYMAELASRMVDAGVIIIGGCCGTAPEHIAAMRDALRQRPKRRAGRARTKTRAVASDGTRQARVVPKAEPTGLAQKLGKRFVVTVEVHPPRGFDVSETLEKLRDLLRMTNVDAFNATDIPLAQGRMSALAMSTLLQTRLGVEAIMHIATRYRNLIALHSDLLGAHALGVRNVFVFMGDPPSIGDYPQAVSFSDVTSSGLIRLIKGANSGLDLSGRPIEQSTSFFTGCALNLEAQDMDEELRSLERKVGAGADYILTQAVFDPEAVERCRQRLGGFPLPVIMGVLPLRSLRHTEFLHNEVPGMVIPESARQRMRDAGRSGAEVGIQLAQELL